MTNHRIFYLTLGITALAITSTQIGVYLLDGSNIGPESSSAVLCNQSSIPTGAEMISVNALINYGNGTLNWYNATKIPSGWNAYQATMYLAKCNVQAEYYGPPLNEHFVTAINGVSGHGSWSWNVWTFCQSQDGWSYSQVGVDQIHLKNGQTIAWVYETTSSTYAGPPVTGSRTVSSCS